MVAYVLWAGCALQASLLLSTTANALEVRFFDPPSGSERMYATTYRSNSPFLPDKESSEYWVSEQAQLRYAYPSREAKERRERGRNRSNVVWVHMHKIGGTWVCKAAKKHGETVSHFNCNWPGDGDWGGEGNHPVYGMVPHKAHCAEREASNIFSLSMIERPLMPGDLHCQNALLGTMVRLPVAWLKSVVAFEALSNETVAGLLQEIRQAKSLSLFVKAHLHHGIPYSTLHHMFDNFMVRTLSGQFDQPIGSLTESDFEAAVETLLRMDVVIPLENLDDHVVQLEKAFQWDRNKITLEVSNHRRVESYLSDEILNEFDDLNYLDRKLYSSALDLATERTSAFLND